ncbi:hypothetical protein PHYSODRAFT_303161 [Phytophthora sojae]|uniref:Uncharacterized protein n=1 Tax=Phytophthora sojae (strain P6497) TaxID=1094619 RepID=G4ZVC3_PHYSP|nr:hypothetical protein PHYSODRAFT_303161 [Phytophthora sojae]EGZ13747.1 hypothetical protein PHYSODRAFT_303161 [Phytophthora sojae]|eukprot:XP_009531176.1 hypothetical protein PHYSODRAFT_303161 [Phytophthora sojae]
MSVRSPWTCFGTEWRLSVCGVRRRWQRRADSQAQRAPPTAQGLTVQDADGASSTSGEGSSATDEGQDAPECTAAARCTNPCVVLDSGRVLKTCQLHRDLDSARRESYDSTRHPALCRRCRNPRAQVHGRLITLCEYHREEERERCHRLNALTEHTRAGTLVSLIDDEVRIKLKETQDLVREGMASQEAYDGAALVRSQVLDDRVRILERQCGEQQQKMKKLDERTQICIYI